MGLDSTNKRRSVHSTENRRYNRGLGIYRAPTEYIFVDLVYGVVENVCHRIGLIQKRGIYLKLRPRKGW